MRTTHLIMLMAVLHSFGFASALQTFASEEDAKFTKYLADRMSEFDSIPEDRKAELKKMTDYIVQRRKDSKPIRMTFICTHNSRRSHMAQLWAAAAAAHFDVAHFQSFSGGTEATAFNPRAVAALERAGMVFETSQLDSNPHYSVTITDLKTPQECFSKVYNSPPNPEHDFCAVMTCSSADKSCPIVAGAEQRIAITYEDPKVADGTDQEASKYDERCAQIAREMLYAFSLIKETEK